MQAKNGRQINSKSTLQIWLLLNKVAFLYTQNAPLDAHGAQTRYDMKSNLRPSFFQLITYLLCQNGHFLGGVGGVCIFLVGTGPAITTWRTPRIGLDCDALNNKNKTFLSNFRQMHKHSKKLDSDSG